MTRQTSDAPYVNVEGAKVDAFGERVKVAIERAGGAKKLATEMGMSTSVIRSWRSGNSDPSRKSLVKMAAAAGVSVQWLATGEEPTEVGGSVREPRPEYAQDEYALIPRYDVQVSAGHGSVVDQERELHRLAFRRQWLRQENLDPQHLVLVTARGDSMEPTISEGDLLLVDTSRPHVQDDAIYVLQVDGEVFAKRLQRDWTGGVWVRSDSPQYEDQHITEQDAAELRIVGRVVWIARRV